MSRLARAAAALCLLACAGLGLAVARAPLPPPLPPSSRAVLDARGAAVAIPLPFRGAAMLFPPSIDDYLLATDRPETLVAAQALNRNAIDSGLMGRMFPSLHALRTLLPGNAAAAPNVETLLRLRPSAVFAAAALAARLRDLGLPALGLVNTQDERWLIARDRIYAEATGETARGAALLAAYRDAMAAVAASVAASAAKPRVLLLASFGRVLLGLGDRVTLAAVLRLAGGVPAVTGTASVRLDRERLLRLDPDIIVLLNVAPAGLGRAQIIADPAWHALRAVAQGRLYRMLPGIEFLPDGLASWPLLARWLAELLHPELPAVLRAQMRATYLRWAGYAMTDGDLDAALAVADNRGAANAARFERP